MDTMSRGGDRLHQELRYAVELIRRSGGNVVLETFPEALRSTPPTASGAQARLARVNPVSVDPAHHSLIQAADRIAGALAQIDAYDLAHPPTARHPMAPRPASAEPSGRSAGAALVSETRLGAEVDRPRRIDGHIDYFGNGGALAARNAPCSGVRRGEGIAI